MRSTQQRGARIAVTALLVLAQTGAWAQQGPGPFVPLAGAAPVPAGNPQSPAKVMLGQALFWDEQLSRTGTVACGTCHIPRAGGGDPRAALDREGSRHPGGDLQPNTADDAIGALGVPRHDAEGHYLHAPTFGMAPQVTPRQSPSMINAAFPALLFWDGRAQRTARLDRHAQLHADTLTVSLDVHSVQLSALEFRLLSALATRPNVVWTRTRLIDQTYGHDRSVHERTIDSHLRNLRRKLDQHGLQRVQIEGVYGAGYRLTLQPAVGGTLSAE